MATAATSTFEESRDDLIAEALENVGAIAPGDTRNDENSALFDSAARTLNRVVKGIDATGQRLWRFARRTTNTTAGTASFSPASDVLEIDEPVRYTRSGETSAAGYLTPMTRDEYMTVSDRTTQGLPRNFYIESTLTTKTVYLWPVPDATGDTIEYAATLRGLDFLDGDDTPDFPAKWTNCLVYALTKEIAPKFNQAPLVATYEALYRDELNRLINDDTERGAMVLVPFGASSGGGAG